MSDAMPDEHVVISCLTRKRSRRALRARDSFPRRLTKRRSTIWLAEGLAATATRHFNASGLRHLRYRIDRCTEDAGVIQA